MSNILDFLGPAEYRSHFFSRGGVRIQWIQLDKPKTRVETRIKLPHVDFIKTCVKETDVLKFILETQNSEIINF